MSTALLAMESPLDNPNHPDRHVIWVLNEILTGVFIIELLIKIAAKGMAFNGNGSYLRNGWNVLDFLILMASIVDFIPGV